VATLFGFVVGFGLLDALLQFILKGFAEKISSFGEEEVFHVVEGLPEGSVVGDEVAFVEEGIEFGVEEFSAVRRGGVGLHKITSL
jgi:hypothetical protein